ncbi:hypothetical protein [Flavobacterium lindanitolerans]|uniref:hypothetical protein n=1 Tax=Flavobacterium lindanitolerans TaxID=428988 RepID=UPI00280781FF|nr:hypothetical protein [Flavobacterium lindanitolerans]MDQ7959860.1 hypothetical protein [Flavobacterium lindanitolerans]
MARERVFTVSSAAYQVFYDILRRAFQAKCYKDHPDRAVSFDSPYLWEDKNPDTGKIFALEFVNGTNLSDTKHFYRRYIDLDPSHKLSGQINIQIFVKGLEYIGIAPTVKGYERLTKPSDKVDHLYQTFLRQYASEIKEVENSIYDNSREATDYLKKQVAKNPELSDAIATVHSFYDNINSGNYKEAWNVLSPIKQNKKPWDGDFEKFKIGYTNTSRLHNIVVLHTHQPRPNILECKVFYDDEINAYTSKELRILDILTVDDLDVFVDQINKLIKIFKEKGLNGFENIELHKLFDPDASEYIWYKANFPTEKLKDIFPIQKSITVRRVQECTCIFARDSWLINEIKSVKSYSLQ